jgi:arginine exporter protein ArgO
MALLPDLAAAGLYAAVVFLVTLGVLVVFVEAIRPSRALLVILVCGVAAALLAWTGETGVALLALGLAAAVLANHVFEWFTTR